MLVLGAVALHDRRPMVGIRILTYAIEELLSQIVETAVGDAAVALIAAKADRGANRYNADTGGLGE